MDPAPVVHVEVLARDPDAQRAFYGALLGWSFDVGGEVAAAVSEPGRYGFVDAAPGGVPAGIGGGEGHAPRALFYAGVPDVGAAVDRAERLGAMRVFGPEVARPGLVVAQVRDPEGNVLGLAGPA